MAPAVSVPQQAAQQPQCHEDPHFTASKPVRRTFPISFLSGRAFYLALALLVASVSSVVQTVAAADLPSAKNGDCVCTFNATQDYFPVKLQPDYARFYKIEYRKSYKLITVLGADKNYTVLGYLCGTPVPAEYADDASVTKVQLPISSVAISSTSTHVPLVEYIGERGAIRYVPEAATDLSPCLAKMYENKRLLAGYNFKGDAPALANITKTTSGPDVIFTDSYGLERAQNVSRDVFGNKNAVILLKDDLESDPMGKIEWIEFVSALFNREKAADGVVSNIKARWECHKATVVQGRANGTIPATRPKVMWLPYGVLKSISCPSSFYWQCAVLEAAGADLLSFPDGLNATTFIPYAQQADALIFPDSTFLTASAYSPVFYNAQMQAALAGTNLVTNKKIFDVMGRPINDWFESAIAEPDVLLLDLIQALYGDTTLIVGSRKRVFLRNPLKAAEAVPPFQGNSGNCTDETAPRFTAWLQSPCTDVGGPLATIPGTTGNTIPSNLVGVCPVVSASAPGTTASAAAVVLAAAAAGVVATMMMGGA